MPLRSSRFRPGPCDAASAAEAFSWVSFAPVHFGVLWYPPVYVIAGPLHLLWSVRIVRRGETEFVRSVGAIAVFLAGFGLFLVGMFWIPLWWAWPDL